MTTQRNDYLDSGDIESINAIEASRLPDAEKDSIIESIRADAWRRHTQSTVSVAGKRETFSIENLRTDGKPKPEGWDESKERVKAQLAQSRMYAPIEGTENSPFHAAEQRELAERERVQGWAERKKLEIEALKESRIEREVTMYQAATAASERKAVLEGLSAEALQRIVSR